MSERRASASLRRTVRERANGCCEYCRSQAKFATEPFAIEHIIPRFVGGKTVSENLALSCFGCNGHKHVKTSALDPVTETDVPLFHPRLQSWSEHFTWSQDYTEVIGLSATGRATVQALQLNRPELSNLRRVLRTVGEHPP